MLAVDTFLLLKHPFTLPGWILLESMTRSISQSIRLEHLLVTYPFHTPAKQEACEAVTGRPMAAAIVRASACVETPMKIRLAMEMGTTFFILVTFLSGCFITCENNLSIGNSKRNGRSTHLRQDKHGHGSRNHRYRRTHRFSRGGTTRRMAWLLPGWSLQDG